MAEILSASLQTVVGIVAAMALVALLELAIPLHARGRWNRAHRAPNLALTSLTFGTNLLFNTALVLALAKLDPISFGILHWIRLPSFVQFLIVLLLLDFSFYLAHVSMHKISAFWSFHAVHHSDPVVDVTTTIRQHPGEGVIRYAFMSVFAIALGAGPGAFAVYRAASALSGLLEHANIRLPRRLDDLLALVVTWPNMHKVHHSRDPGYTDTNYSNLFSVWDRLFGTFTPAHAGSDVAYGLTGRDDPALQTTGALLIAPFRRTEQVEASATSFL